MRSIVRKQSKRFSIQHDNPIVLIFNNIHPIQLEDRKVERVESIFFIFKLFLNLSAFRFFDHHKISFSFISYNLDYQKINELFISRNRLRLLSIPFLQGELSL